MFKKQEKFVSLAEIFIALINFRVDYYFYVSKFFSIPRNYSVLPLVASIFS